MPRRHQLPPIDVWLKMSEAAKLMDLPIHKARRRLKSLNAAYGGSILRKFSENGKYSVSATALLRELRTEPEQRESELAELRSILDGHERRLETLRRNLRKLSGTVKRLAEVTECDRT